MEAVIFRTSNRNKRRGIHNLHHSKAHYGTEADADTIRYEATIEDPKVFTRTWKISMPLYRHVEKNAQLLEYECQAYLEAERDRRDTR